MKKEIEKNGGSRGGGSRGGSRGRSRGGPGGSIRQESFFKFFAFRNRAQGSDRVGRGDNFSPPHWGYPPWYAQEGSDKIKMSDFFGVTQKKSFLTQKKVKILFFQNRLLKRILRVLGLSYHSTTFFSADSLPTPTGKASKMVQIRVKISQFSPKNRAFSRKKIDYSWSFGDFSFLGSSLNAVVVFNAKHAALVTSKLKITSACNEEPKKELIKVNIFSRQKLL